MKQSFQNGDAVSWSSQAAGYTRTKTGVVVQVVPAGAMPDRQRFERLYKGAGVGGPRDHESFVILVPGKTSKAAGTLYWPRAAGLKLTATNALEDSPGRLHTSAQGNM